MRPGLPARRRGLWIALLVAALLAVGGVAAAILLTRGGGESASPSTSAPSSVTSAPATTLRVASSVVPQLVGLEEPAARARVRALRLQVLVRRKASPGPAGVVLVQNPAAGVRLPHGAAVGLVVSTGRTSSVVPAVTGESVAVAISKLRAAGYAARTRSVASQRRAGRVVAQTPAAGARQKGGSVLLAVSSGAPRVTVPSVVGSPRSVALREVRSVGLVPSVKTLASQRPPGTVLAQAPTAGESVPRGSTVSLRVATGAKGGRTTVPDVKGRPQAQAQAIVRAAKLTPRVKRVHSLLPVGTVVSQRPAAGTAVPRQAVVTISVSSGPGP